MNDEQFTNDEREIYNEELNPEVNRIVSNINRIIDVPIDSDWIIVDSDSFVVDEN